jgi:hypothetical protein
MKAQEWLIQPGIVKKLQFALAISFCLNIFFILDKIPKNQKESSQEKTVQKEEQIKEVSELEIKNFIKDYLNYFFSTGLVAQSFIEKNSNPVLYRNELKTQLETRTNKDLKSDLNILDFYIEPEAKDKFRVILVGIESFENKDYQNREITMILNLEKQENSFIVVSIPKFEVKA